MADSLTELLGPLGNPFRVLILFIAQVPFIALLYTFFLRYSVKRLNKMMGENLIVEPSILKGFGCSLVFVIINFLALLILKFALKQWGWYFSHLVCQIILSPYLILINALILKLALPESFKRALAVASIVMLIILGGSLIAATFHYLQIS